MRVALTGTPGTGKTSVAEVLIRRGYHVVYLDRLAEERKLIVGIDPTRNTREVDIEALDEAVHVPVKLGFLVGHYAHLLSVNLAIVLRCRPMALAERLRARGWSETKVRENAQAEAIDVITQEAVARLPYVYEIDTTSSAAEESASTVLRILQGRTKGHEPGRIDWGDEVLSWS